MATKANIYPLDGDNPTVTNSCDSRANIGICFSGGGSRALTCAWGQMLGLRTLSLMDKVRYISSVSGGTWASSIYAYLPENITDEELLGTFFPPENLSLSTSSGDFNVNNLDKYSFGQAPKGMALGDLTLWAGIFLLLHDKSEYKWFWAYIVGSFVLEPYGLRAKGDKWWSSTKSFSLSESYAEKNFPKRAPCTSNFFFVRSEERPFLIMNDNILVEGIGNADINLPDKVLLLPNQVTPVSGGAQGETPNGSIIGGGSVESYGYNSALDQESADTSPVDMTISQPYSLIDIVSCSSAFFAGAIANFIQLVLNSPKEREDLIRKIEAELDEEHKNNLLDKVAEDLGIHAAIEVLLKDIAEDLGDLIPSYNYWPVGKASENKEMGYTDGGSLDNTGVLGMLAQTEARNSDQESIKLVVFDNTDTPLVKRKGNIVAASQAAPLFGIDFNTADGTYKPFSAAQKDPTNKSFVASSLITVFENSINPSGNTPFDDLVQGLYNASCGTPPGETPADAKVGTEPAFYQQELTTVHNPLANVTAGRVVNMIYIQNAKIMKWQSNIGDKNLGAEIAEGQASSNPFATFHDFPYYSTFFKIGLEAKESNALSQMWAWAIADDSSPLKQQVQTFLTNTGG